MIIIMKEKKKKDPVYRNGYRSDKLLGCKHQFMVYNPPRKNLNKLDKKIKCLKKQAANDTQYHIDLNFIVI